MPTVPQPDAPSILPNAAPTQVAAPPEAFGLSVLGKGLENAGIALDQQSTRLAQHAEQFQAVNNKVASDQAFVDHLQAANQFVEKYKADNLGIAAENNLPAALETLEAQRKSIGATLTNPNARVMFDADSRRAIANLSGELSRFATTQRKDYVVHQANAVQEALVSDTALHPENADANGLKLLDQQAFINTQLGLSPEEGDLRARKAYGAMISTSAEAMNNAGKSVQAAAFLEAHKDKMDGTVYEQTLAKLRPALNANAAAAAGDLAVDGALHGLGSPTGPTLDYLSNVHGREGTGKNPDSSASGIGQFLGRIDAKGNGSGTWFDLLKSHPEFAGDIAGKTDKEILALRNDPQVADRAIMAYAGDNSKALSAAGLPVNSATLGLAHGYGPAGAKAIISADPSAPIESVIGAKVAQNNRVAGQTVGQVQQAFVSRFGTGQSIDGSVGGAPTSFDLKSRMQQVLANADSIADRQRPGDADYKDKVEQRAISGLNRQIGAANDTEYAAYTTLGTAIDANNIQDQNTLFRTVPGAAAAWNALPLSHRNALTASMNREAAEITPQRMANMDMLNGMYAERRTSPEAFLGANIAGMDLPRAQRLQYLKAQDELRHKPDAVAGADKVFTTIMHSPQTQAQLNALDVKPKTDDYWHFAGALQGELDQWNAQHKDVPPGPKDVAKMLANVSAQKYSTYGIPGMSLFDFKRANGRVFDVNEDDAAAATSFLTTHGLPVNPATIGKYVRERGLIAEQAKARGYSASPSDLDTIYAARVNNAR